MKIDGGSLKMEEKTVGGKIGVYLQWSKTAFLVRNIGIWIKGKSVLPWEKNHLRKKEKQMNLGNEGKMCLKS